MQNIFHTSDFCQVIAEVRHGLTWKAQKNWQTSLAKRTYMHGQNLHLRIDDANDGF